MTKAAELAKMGEVLTNSQIGGRRNIIINGAMQVAQRATSATGISSSAYHTVDRHKFSMGNTAGRLTMTQESITDLSGFTKAIKLDCTTADTSIASNEYAFIQHSLEGQDLQQLKKGTSDAEKVTLSFYVKGNASATYTVELEDGDNSRLNSQEFSVTSSWTRVVKTFAADTTGTLDNDNAESLRISFWLHGGSNYTGGTHSSNTWHTTENQRLGDNQTSFFDSTDRTFFITGIQLEVGSQATPFEHRSFGEELALCQRYYQEFGEPTGTYYTLFPSNRWSTNTNFITIFTHENMRAAPSLSMASGSTTGDMIGNTQSDSFTIGNMTVQDYDGRVATISIGLDFDPSATVAYVCRLNEDNVLALSSEL
jgi:hypothetical protein